MACQPAEDGGYQYSYIEDPPESLQCPVCLLPCREPHILDCCGGKFCRTCIDRVENANQPCPLCRKFFKKLIDRQHERKILSLKVRCNFRDGGCEWEGELRHIDNHLERECHYVPVTCRYRCGYRCIRKDMDTHEEDDCEGRPLELKLIKKVESLERKVVILEQRCNDQDNLIAEQHETVDQQRELLEQQREAFEQQKQVVADHNEEAKEQTRLIEEQEKETCEKVKELENTLGLYKEEQKRYREQFVQEIEETMKESEVELDELRGSVGQLKGEFEDKLTKQEYTLLERLETIETDTQHLINEQKKEIKNVVEKIRKINEENLKNQIDLQQNHFKTELGKMETALKGELVRKGTAQKKEFDELKRLTDDMKLGLQKAMYECDIEVKNELSVAIDKRVTLVKETFLTKATFERHNGKPLIILIN